MDRRRVWPDFYDACILHTDADLVVVDKPAGVSTQAADPERPDDLVTRVRAHLDLDYLGVHQRLDRDTSGVLVFARRKEANRALAAQFEGRTVEKRYLACVTGWPKSRAEAVLRDRLGEGDRGAMRVVAGGGKGKLAVTRVKVLERRGDRAMLELFLETGRTHQARAQLAHAGAPIAGDALYGGATAPRLLLHASAIALEHPAGRRRVRFEAPVPPEMRAWLERADPGRAVFDDARSLGAALDRAIERRWGLGRADAGPRATTAFRLINEEGDGLPGLAVDLYGGHLVVQLYDDMPEPTLARVLDALMAKGFDGAYLKRRPKQANVLVDTRREDLAPRAPVRGVPAPDPLPILEEGVPLLVRLGDGLSTGLFLDQRENRRRVRALARDAAVVNLFSYTCAFTVAAALGGARRTVSVDAAAVAIERGMENLAHAGVDGAGMHAFVVDDAASWLRREAKKPDKYDLAILDPPSYSTTKKSRFSAAADYAELAAATLAILARGGRLLACTNHRGVTRAKFRKMLHEGARRAGRRAVQVKDLPDPSDFPPAPGRECHLKSVLVTLE
jgi:23S rRNA (cytosine1962-C5)-methyltransferase